MTREQKFEAMELVSEEVIIQNLRLQKAKAIWTLKAIHVNKSERALAEMKLLKLSNLLSQLDPSGEGKA